ncbi:lef12 protein [Gynaephora ruoergensis nucleopolyhedrovirus]|nr:lef12 protein [Gynaephora ruoergensis nucleopolyhedrovirus]
MFNNVVLLDKQNFVKKIQHVSFFIKYVNHIVDELVRHKEISIDDVDSLCLSDDTAAWVCGRIQNCNFVTFRIRSAQFDQRKSSVLDKHNFTTSLEQTVCGLLWTRLEYFKFVLNTAVVKLIIFRDDCKDIVASNPCPQLSYFIKNKFCETLDSGSEFDAENINEAVLNNVFTRDCDCLRKKFTGEKYARLLFDLEPRNEADAHHRSLILQESLIEDLYDENTIKIICNCLSSTQSDSKQRLYYNEK